MYDHRKILQSLLEKLSEEEIKDLMEEHSRYPGVTLLDLIVEYENTIEGMLSNKYLDSHRISNKYIIEIEGAGKLLKDISLQDAQRIVANLSKKAPKGWATYYRNLHALFQFAEERGYIQSNPFTKVVLPKKQRKLPSFISNDELQVILSKILTLVIKLIVEFAFYTGMRRSEIINLRWQHVNFDTRLITIGDEQLNTKTKEPRVIPMADRTYEILTERYRLKKKNQEFVFTKENGHPYDGNYVSQVFKEAVRKSKVGNNIHFHSLRHSTASNLVQKGVSLYIVKDILGHKSIATTEIYSHLNTKALQEAIQVFNVK